ncbi:hypothetical protein WN943_003677 [Citrus x changshan-huyou]
MAERDNARNRKNDPRVQPALLKFSQVSSSRCVGSDLPHHAAASKSQHSSRSVGSDLPHAAIALSPTAVVIVLLRQFV